MTDDNTDTVLSDGPKALLPPQVPQLQGLGGGWGGVRQQGDDGGSPRLHKQDHLPPPGPGRPGERLLQRKVRHNPCSI